MDITKAIDVVVSRLERDLTECFSEIGVDAQIATDYLIIDNVVDMVLSDGFLSDELIMAMADSCYREGLTLEIYEAIEHIDDSRVLITDLELLADCLEKHFVIYESNVEE